MNTYLVVRAERCTGCESCVFACSFKYDGKFSLKARIHVHKLKSEDSSFPSCVRIATMPPVQRYARRKHWCRMTGKESCHSFPASATVAANVKKPVHMERSDSIRKRIS